MNNPVEALSETFVAMQRQIDTLEATISESLAHKLLALEDIGWTKLSGQADDSSGLTLETLHDLIPNLRDMAAANPLHKRGAQLRHAYVFGRGINFTGVDTPRVKNAMSNLYNKNTLFNVQAYTTLNLAKFTDGNVFVVRDETTNVFVAVPIQQISAVITDPDDASKVRYFRRTWSSNGTEKTLWYPLARYKKSQVGRGKRGGKINKTITVSGRVEKVAQTEVMYHEASNRQTGWTFGIPDSLAASVWTVAYSEYLSDNSALVKALQQIAWTVQSATKKSAANAAVAVAQPGVGGTAVLGGGNMLASAGVPSAQVNMNNGQPLAAMVATSLAVPVIALLSSPGATGGSYGAATTLDEPTLKGMTTVQEEWKGFYEEILTDIGATNPEVSFPNISQDPIYRELQSLSVAYTSGAIHQDEYREAVLALADIKSLHDGPPKPDEFNAGTDPSDGTDPAPRQGNAGAVAGGVEQDDTNHDPDTEN